jgi:3-hydroxyacyl-[acyl-carrier-protein] dehydratase
MQKVEIMSSPSPETLDQIKVLLRRDLKVGPDIAIPDDMPFAGTEADFDSLDILLLLTSIEKQFHIKIPSEVVGKEVFKNVSTLASYVEREAASGNPQPDYLAKLPHRDPFRFISKVKSIKHGEEGEAAWTLSGNEPFFAGHFPNQPLVPGVLIAEALAQLSGLVGPSDARQGKLVHVDVRFDQSVAPPAEIVLRSKCLRTVGGLEQFEVSASVRDDVVARGMLTLSRPRDGEPGGAL